jgi:hypothetical protein
MRITVTDTIATDEEETTARPDADSLHSLLC